MRLCWIAIVIAGSCVLACSAPPAESPEDSLPLPDPFTALAGRYPTLVVHPTFVQWHRTQNVARWHEMEASDDGTRLIVVQGDRAGSILAARIRIPEPEVAGIVLDVRTAQTAAREVVISEFQRANPPGADDFLLAARPNVEFRPSGILVTWQVELLRNGALEVYDYNNGAQFRLVSSTPLPPSGPAHGLRKPRLIVLPWMRLMRRAGPIEDDSLAANELHHPSAFAEEARRVVGNAPTVSAQANAIYVYLLNRYRYDGNIEEISCLTWSDELVRDVLGRRGICDELAVVAVTYLRALGIRATIKILTWKSREGKPVAHECIEYQDGDTWKHMDLTYRVLHKPSIYRERDGATSVSVRSATNPRDESSRTPSFGCRDPDGDQRLQPYRDFELGAPRTVSGYSY